MGKIKVNEIEKHDATEVTVNSDVVMAAGTSVSSPSISTDTISEKTSASGVTIDGVLVKDGAIASSYISGLTTGLDAAQQFVLTSSISTTGTNVITTNIAVPSEANMGNLGSLVSESSGIFSFSETGFYLVQVITSANYNADNSYAQIYLEATINNTDYSRLAYTYLRGKNDIINQGFVQVILDITDTSNHKVRFSTDITTGGIVLGSTSDANTSFTFMKLGDT